MNICTKLHSNPFNSQTHVGSRGIVMGSQQVSVSHLKHFTAIQLIAVEIYPPKSPILHP